MSEPTTDEQPQPAPPAPMWHAYGPKDDGTFHVHGPSEATPDFAATLASIAGAPYKASFDHEPTPDELTS